MHGSRTARVAAGIVLVALALALGSCSRQRSPNILWIVWDTVRADHLGVYGYDRPTTPNLDRWAEGARVFDDCVSVAGYTLPSHASMFTGLLPSEHCTDNDQTRLEDSYTTIAELLRAAGYRTYLYSANPHISTTGNFTQGFDLSEHPWSERFRARAEAIVREKLAEGDQSSELGPIFERADRGEGGVSAWNIKAAGELAGEALVEWLDSAPDDRPFFAFVNYMEAHRPLIPSREHRERMMSAEDVARSFEVDRSWLATWEYTFGLRDIDDDALELTRATYDAAVAELDDLFGSLMRTLAERGDLEDTIVIVTSDHGDHLGEQHMLDHQYSLYEPLVRVPLIVHDPVRFPAGRDARPVASFDLFPTLLEIVGLTPPEGASSRAVSLLAPETARNRIAEDTAHAQVPITMVQQEHPDWDPTPWQRRLQAWFEGEHKLIVGSDGRGELFDLTADPGERSDLSGDRVELADRLRGSLESYVGSLQRCRRSGAPPPELTPEQIERLKALGYLGG